MKTKSLILGCLLFVLSGGAFAQKAELNTAKSSYDKFAGLKNPNTMNLAVPSLKEAKTSIDKVVLHEKTKNDASAWTYRALIYADLALLDSVPTTAAPLVTEASSALKKATELDKEGQNKEKIQNAGKLLAQYSLNKGVREFQSKSYSEAYGSFNSALTALPGDTTLTYYAGLSAMLAKDYPNAIQKYTQLLNTNYSLLEDVYSNLSVLYATQKDTASAIRIAGEGAKKFPKSSSLATREIEFSLMTGKQKEIISKIEDQSQKEPNNKLYPYYLGIAYNAAKDYPKAEAAYKKAIAIDPNYADANINLSGLIMNNGIEIYNKANKLPTSKQTEYKAMMNKANAEFDRALPYLQKATELDPKSRLALENLRTYYVVKGNTAKASEVKKQIDAIQ